MVSRNLIAAIAMVLAVPAIGAEMLVFKTESRYKGAALRIEALKETKDGRLLITAVGGDLYTAAAADVDWEKSKKLTLAMQEKQATMDAEERVKAEARRHGELLRAQEGQQLSVLEASRRFGVDKPAFSVSDGSAFREQTAPPAEGSGEGAATSTGSSGASPALHALKARAEAAKADVDSIQKKIASLEADRNPDPVSASLRRSELERRQGELTTAQAKAKQLETELLAAVTKAAEAAAAAAK